MSRLPRFVARLALLFTCALSACVSGESVSSHQAAAGGSDAGAGSCGLCAAIDACHRAGCEGASCVQTLLDDGSSCASGATSICVSGTCRVRGCGDGFVEPGPERAAEECDDGNGVAEDGCSASCTVEGIAIDRSATSAYATLGSATAQNVGVDAQGRVLVVYRRRQGGSEGVYAKRLSPTGASLDTTPLVLDASLGLVPTSADPTVVGLSTGGWVVAWTAVRASSFDVVFRLVKTDGSLDPEIVANRFRTGTQWDAELVALDAGFVLAWTDEYGVAGDPGAGVVARVFDASGNGRTQDLRVAVDRNGNQGQVALTRNPIDTIRQV